MLWGALNNASMGMMAMSWDMGSISQNIANVNTTGYKRKETLFSTVLSEGHAAPSTTVGGLNIFGVQTKDRTHITSQGIIAPSQVGSDLGINGRGFFMVSPPGVLGPDGKGSVDVANPAQVQYTRDGSFQYTKGTKNESILTTGNGSYVLGWMADAKGHVSANAPLGIVSFNYEDTLPGKGTDEAAVRANLPSDSPLSPMKSSYQSQIVGRYYDKVAGVAKSTAPSPITYEWERTPGAPPGVWTVTPKADKISISPASVNVQVDGWGNPIAPAGGISFTADWEPGDWGGNGQIVTPTRDPEWHWEPDFPGGPSLRDMIPSIPLERVTIPIYDASGNAHTAVMGFEHVGTNTWALHPNGGEGSSPSGAAPILIQFSPEGQMITPQPLDISLKWGGTTQSFKLDLKKMSQFNNGTQVALGEVTQDGYPEGKMISSSFNEKGEMSGYFTNGKSRLLFKLPLATFVAENSLEPLSGNVFSRSAAAGEIAIHAVEDVPGGTRVAPSSLELSTVDIGEEFSKMIMTQKAYTTNATVFRTADEMTVTARDLKA